jgi:predicted amidohydrolase
MQLEIAFVHFAAGHRQNQENRQKLLELLHQAAAAGTDIVLAPEMALSGYSFRNRADIAPHVTEENSAFLRETAAIAAEYGCYLAVGLAEQERESGIFYNALFVFGPRGELCRYRKINAESRWACPGDPGQNNLFTTPWGKIGVLICSDSYHGVMPRLTALRGARLLLIAANWPPTGLDPVELWRARAFENGIPIAVCNRTGQDLEMDCRRAESCLIDGRGEILLRRASPTSMVFHARLPLPGGRLDDHLRTKRLARRRPELYHSCYRNLSAIPNLTSYFELPPPGQLNLKCMPVQSFAELSRIGEAKTGIFRHSSLPTLILLPRLDCHQPRLNDLGALARRYRFWLLASHGGERLGWSLFKPDGRIQHWDLPRLEAATRFQPPYFDIGPARATLVPFSALTHPELPLALAKEGCDLVIASETRLPKTAELSGGVATLNHLAVAACGRDRAGIWLYRDGHQRWQERLAPCGQICSLTFDTTRLRHKRFQNRIDFKTLFTPPQDKPNQGAGNPRKGVDISGTFL